MAAKTVLVVGGAGGVGSAVLKRLVEGGYRVIATTLLEAEARDIERAYDSAVACHAVDLGDADAALVALKNIVSGLDALDAVVVCAAIAPPSPMELTSLATYRKAYEINCVSEIAVYQATLPTLRKSGGRIVLMGSLAGRVAFTFMSAYGATKFALEGLCDVMRREAAPQGVKVSLIQPGAIRTNLVYQQFTAMERDLAGLGEAERDRYGYLYDAHRKVSEASMAGNSSTPEQVAETVLTAIEAEQPKARYVVGQDAEDFFELTRTLSDEDIDDLFRRLYSGESEVYVRQ
jgi:NAD(P)-dependent dehydrogenase (short-subunit alcohol dehydrogenase family)